LNSDAALKQLFILSDPEPVSMAEIIYQLRRGAGLKGAGLRVPPILLSTGLRLLGRHDLWLKMGENLVTSVAKLKRFGFRWSTGTKEALCRLGSLYANAADERGRDQKLVPYDLAATPTSAASAETVASDSVAKPLRG
jgi:UDP-glucose 4-epimerase